MNNQLYEVSLKYKFFCHHWAQDRKVSVVSFHEIICVTCKKMLIFQIEIVKPSFLHFPCFGLSNTVYSEKKQRQKKSIIMLLSRIDVVVKNCKKSITRFFFWLGYKGLTGESKINRRRGDSYTRDTDSTEIVKFHNRNWNGVLKISFYYYN